MSKMVSLTLTKQPNLAVLKVRGAGFPGIRPMISALSPHAYSISKLKSDVLPDARSFVKTIEKAGVNVVTVPADKTKETLEVGIRFAEMEEDPSLDLTSADTYQLSVLLSAARQIAHTFGWNRASYLNTKEIDAGAQKRLLEYPDLAQLRTDDLGGGEIAILPTAGMPGRSVGKALYSLLFGEVLTEHTFAGEATRLKLGTKALLDGQKLIDGALANEIELAADYKDILPIELGSRHMAQFASDLMKLARPVGIDPQKALENQHMLVTLNEQTSEQVIGAFLKSKHFMFDHSKVLFMVQKSFEGMTIEDGELYYDPNSEKRLHNHGSMAMQIGMDEELFFVKPAGRDESYDKVPVSRQEYEGILKGKKNKISFNVEDLGFLGNSIDLQALALAYEAGKAGYAMVMEVVGQKDPPQKGGFAAYNRSLGRVVMIESDQGGFLVNEKDPDSLRRIQYLNRNFNMFPDPLKVFLALMEKGLPLHLTLKDGFLYPQPPQGDQNFLVPTQFFRREVLWPISNLKTIHDIEPTLKAFMDQDKYGFAEACRRMGLIPA